MANKKDMSKNEILKYLGILNEKLKYNDQNVDILICGGASMILAFGQDRMTQDIDAVILNSEVRMDVLNYANQIAKEENLSDGWFNEGAKGFIDLSWNRDEFTHFSNLNIYSVPAEQLLAMKLSSGRRFGRDKEDAITLMKHLRLNSSEEALEILEKNINGKLLTAKTQYFTLDVFSQYEKQIQEMVNIAYLAAISVPYTDAFFIDSENRDVEWIYYNPDCNAGGQYVIRSFDYDLIKEAAYDWQIPDEFFDFIGNCSNQVLVDVGDFNFEETERRFLSEENISFVGNTEDLEEMKKALISNTIENTEKNVYLNLHNNYIQKEKEYSMVTLPKGVVVDDKDLSGGRIYPPDQYIFPCKVNSNFTTVQFPEEQSIRVNLDGGDISFVNAKELNKAVDLANKQYLEENKEKMAEAEMAEKGLSQYKQKSRTRSKDEEMEM